jgi:hypothetical protein
VKDQLETLVGLMVERGNSFSTKPSTNLKRNSSSACTLPRQSVPRRAPAGNSPQYAEDDLYKLDHRQRQVLVNLWFVTQW